MLFFLCIVNVYYRLENETSSLLAYLEPTKAETRMREYLIHKIRTVVNQIAPFAEVEVFGSFSTNLYLPNRLDNSRI